ncbi:TetR/AcrR family transcriptional regulator [Alteriqipengyuania lutimaris]|uniref:TetR/AcrR family transcriptional regulator n=1 Tax=Alteriqipengyuania lutimaris TaxID=1538146 RepID=A0A395LKH5_9SPHN|nr:TetR/AcrR family transcriptional regulator [Alteriqipengyuania lutimaris]MBB3033713.1 AcrR family transcriptional regulator [Alteriqipengyuania lutimaris]RDS77301.1 TetR/AcrR family transcriptional regulator [Alteriqipengyuania lutimaris]
MNDAQDFCRLDRRRNAVVEAARALFVEQGFERTTLGDIVERAGGSLATVYKVFGSKDGLLEAVVFEKAASGEEIIQGVVAEGGSPAHILQRIAEGLHGHFLDPEVVALVRIVIARSINDRDFASRFFERTATRTKRALEVAFSTWEKEGVAMDGEPEALAEIFLDMIVSDLHAEAISHGVGSRHSSDRLRARTEFFLAGAGMAGR